MQEEEEDQPILNLKSDDVSEALLRIQNGYKSYYGPATTNETGCLLAGKMGNKGRDEGWPKCKVGGSRAEFYVHHLALIAAGRKDELRGLNNGKQVSHLCHHRNCFNASHLIVEDGEANRERNKCHGWTWIECPCGCKYSFNPCKHSPQCILFP